MRPPLPPQLPPQPSHSSVLATLSPLDERDAMGANSAQNECSWGEGPSEPVASDVSSGTHSGESSEDENSPNFQSTVASLTPPTGRSRSSSIDILANAAFLKAPPPQPQLQPQQQQRRERMDSISSLVEAVEQRSRSDSLASTGSADGNGHKYGTRGRLRSYSNPEGMERYSYMPAVATAALPSVPQNRTLQLMNELERRKDEEVSYDDMTPPVPTFLGYRNSHYFNHDLALGNYKGRTSSQPKSNPRSKARSKSKYTISSRRPSVDLSTITVVDVVPDPLTSKVSYDSLRLKKEPLLDAMSKSPDFEGQMTYPHAIGGYKNVYNKEGRVGIYTTQERKAILERFRDKRQRRVWVKKIRYDCRKNLADRRIRVKGRFVKMTPEQAAEALTKQREEQSLQQPGEEEIYERARRYTIG
mmetsp:Transcript_11331/g.23151  ORF Transcript_11331/g.23151 Transcript_11331/m.23151 type:complete len:416 (+) Transcript_11331:176-1423(+)|eukprot:CAMPEP_0118662086 /NCGR_PEP_ID=MMETSP0785-20121206/16631_1 /TAXON_ID=91992 /ORGANISM="Bolidomonas pacifica, Strain CCMP 1866" /LENGTH=415 /DNA_ID=CAMNT_0006555581 /DNA_START=132 /DNA_END=1379 /DNA_ORIENTATION=+